MEFIAQPNHLLEAIAYLGARANGYTISDRVRRLANRGIQDLSPYVQRSAPLERLAEQLDGRIALPAEVLRRLFGDIEGFPSNSTGLYSPTFLLLHPLLARCGDDFAKLESMVESLTDAEAAKNLMISLGTEAESCTEPADPIAAFLDYVLSLSVPADSRLALVGILRSYQVLLTEALSCIRQVLSCFDKLNDPLADIAKTFAQEIDACGCEEYLKFTSQFTMKDDIRYVLRPYIFGPDTNLSLSPSGDTEVIYCGILRHVLRKTLEFSQDPRAVVYDTLKLLSDKTRFDILCVLRERSAYGQELSEQLGLSRNTIHHHMGKLLNAGLVICTTEGNRIYYTLDKEHLAALMEQQRIIVLGK